MFCHSVADQLVEPEFAGLWDKQPTGSITLTTDDMPRTKACNASKMEKVC